MQIPFFRKISQCRIHDGPGRGAETPRRPPQDTSLKTEVDTIHHYAPNHFSIDLYMFFFFPLEWIQPLWYDMLPSIQENWIWYDPVRSHRRINCLEVFLTSPCSFRDTRGANGHVVALLALPGVIGWLGLGKGRCVARI